MAQGSRVCPSCGRLNAADDKACYNCGKRLPGPFSSSALRFITDFSEDGLPATKLIAGICIVVYGLMMATDATSGGRGSGLSGLFSGFRMSTSLRFGALHGYVFSAEPWRVLSAVFLHASLLHIGMNMLSLVSLGRSLEPHFRSGRFMLLYLLSGGLGFCATVWYRGTHAFSVGASGAIFGLLGAFIGALIIRRNPGWQRVFVSNLIMACMLGFVFSNVDNAAHLGGFAAGLVLGLLLEVEPQPRKRDGLMTALAALGVLAVLASIALSARSPVWKEVRELEAQERGN
jgi:membrane associated rhomboid family serine protease